MFTPTFRPLIRPLFKPLHIVTPACYALNFNGVNSYGRLANPVGFVDGSEIEISFSIDSLRTTDTPALYGPDISDAFHSRAIIESNGQIVVRPTVSQSGFTELKTPIGAVTLNTNHIFKLSRTGDIYELYFDGVLVDSLNVPFGSMIVQEFARAALVRHFPGFIYWIKLNGTYYPLSDRDQHIQPSFPAGNDLTLFNVVPEQWEEIPCNLRP